MKKINDWGTETISEQDYNAAIEMIRADTTMTEAEKAEAKARLYADNGGMMGSIVRGMHMHDKEE